MTGYIRGYVDNVSTTLEYCLMAVSGACYGPWKPFALPVGAGNIATVEIGDPNQYVNPQPAAAMLSGWLAAGQQYPQVFFNKNGTAANVGNVLTLTGTGSGFGAFDVRWTPATRITYAGSVYHVVSVTNGISMTITPHRQPTHLAPGPSKMSVS